MQKVRAEDDTSLCASINDNRLLDKELKEQYRNAPLTSQMLHNFKCIFNWMRERFCLNWEMFLNPLLDFLDEVDINGKSCQLGSWKQFAWKQVRMHQVLPDQAWQLCHVQRSLWNTVAPRADKSTAKLDLLVNGKEAKSLFYFSFLCKFPK